MLQDEIRQFRELISANKIDECFDIMIPKLADSNVKLYHSVLIQKSIFTDLKLKISRNLISHEVETKERSKVCNSLLDIISQIEQEQYKVAEIDGTKTLREEEWKHFIGPFSKIYIKRWNKIESGGESLLHISAFVSPAFWLLYRKMYLELIILLIVAAIASTCFIALTYDYYLDNEIDQISQILTIFSNFLFSLIANKLYYNHSMRKIKSIKLKSQNYQEYINYLRKTGGVSILNLFIAIGLLIVFVFVSIV